MKELFVVIRGSGDWEEIARWPLFVTDSEYVAQEFCKKFKRILEQGKNFYDSKAQEVGKDDPTYLDWMFKAYDYHNYQTCSYEKIKFIK